MPYFDLRRYQYKPKLPFVLRDAWSLFEGSSGQAEALRRAAPAGARKAGWALEGFCFKFLCSHAAARSLRRCGRCGRDRIQGLSFGFSRHI